MSEHNVVDEATAGDGAEFRAILEVDEDAWHANPRDNDYNVGVMACIDPSNRWHVPTEDNAWVTGHIADYSFRVVARWLRVFHGATVVLPLGHRGFPAGSPDATDDAGNYFGVIYDTPETRKRTGVQPEHIEEALQAEVAEYGAWAEGEVFFVAVERKCACCESWNNEDAVGGFIGSEYAESEARRMLAEAITVYETDNAIGPTDD